MKDASYKNNREFRKYIKMYQDEKDPQKKEEHRQNLGKMLAEAMMKGNKYFSTSMPKELLKAASDVLAKQGIHVTIDKEDSTPSPS